MSSWTTLRIGKAALDLADVVFQAANHHFVKHLLIDRNASAKTLRIEDFQQGGETIGMAVVRGRGKKEPMLKPGSDLPN